MTPDRTKAARELLAFYLEAGVDALVGETSVDHLAAETQPAPGPATTTLASTPAGPAAPRVPGSRPPLTRAAPAAAAPARRAACPRHRRHGGA